MSIMLSDKYSRAIERNRENIVADLLVGDILSDLRSCESFTRSDEEIVRSKVTSVEKASMLLDILHEKDDSCFEHFLDVLSSTYVHLAEGLTATINNKRSRRMSNTEFGELLIKGGVPDCTPDYIPRKLKEDEILLQLKSGNSKPILVHGVIGCGKSSIVSQVLHSENIFPDRYTRVCWMPIGNITENDVLSKLIILSAKLDSKNQESFLQIPDLYKDRITEKLCLHNVLLILDDIWNAEIMKYFLFPTKYIVTSRNSNLFSQGQAMQIEIPSQFSESECNMFLGHYIGDISLDLKKVIIEKSHRNPLTLSMIKNLLNNNKDYFNFIPNIKLKDLEINEIIKRNIDILDSEMQRCFEMLSILNEDDAVSINLLMIYWDINENTALQCVNKFCNNHLMLKTWSEEYKCNLYILHDLLWDYLQQNKMKVMEFKNIFINNYKRRYINWIKFDHCDPYFFTHCGRILNSINDVNTLRDLFTDFSFISSKIVISGITDLLFDYDNYRPSHDSSLWEEFNRFFMRHNHRFVQLPNSDINIKIKKVFMNIIQLAFSEGQGSNIYEKAIDFKHLAMRNDFWVWDNVEPSMKIWEASHIDNIALMDINHCGIILTSDSGRISLYDFNSGNCLFNYKIFNSNKCILCKFLQHDTLEFVILSESGQLQRFDILKLLGQQAKVNEKIVEDDDYDQTDNNFITEKLKIDFGTLRQKFRHILIPEFLKICQKQDLTLKTNRIFITGSLGDGRIYAASEPSTSNASAHVITLIEYYDNDDFQLIGDFTVSYKVKKIVHVKIQNNFKVYALAENGSALYVYDYLGEQKGNISIADEVIIDFIIFGNDVYLAARNNVYKNKDTSPLFSTKIDVNITHVSMCYNQSLMSLSLTNQSIQIWKVFDKKMLYSLKGYYFTNIQFGHCGTHLITTEGSNVSKWSIEYMNSINQNNQNNNQHYRVNFYMHTFNSSVTWIFQKYTNELEFRSYNNGDYSCMFTVPSSKATCFSIEDGYAFIGFITSNVQVYNLSDLSCELTLASVNNVSNLATFACDDDQWNVIVHYDVNKIKIFSIKRSDRSYSEGIERILGEISELKIFKISIDYLIIGLRRNHECVLYNVNTDLRLNEITKKYITSYNNIIDFDVNDQGNFLCVATSTGTLKIWEIETSRDWEDCTEENTVIRICKFRPHVSNFRWNVVASVTDEGEIRLFYFNNDEWKVNIIIEDIAQTSIGIFSTIKWAMDGEYLIYGDNDIKKWKVPMEPMSIRKIKHQLTKLYTYSGGIRCVHLNNNFICTIDQMGLFYIFRKI